MTLRDHEITVLGGGIGGLAAALACARRGARVRLLEQAPALSEVGAGLQISPNGIAVLDALGLGERFRAVSDRGRAVSLRDHARGREVLRLDLARLDAGRDYRFVHRADLVDLLAGAVEAAGVTLALSSRITALRPGNPVRLERNDETLAAPLVIAADGLNSVARPVLNGAAEPGFTGQIAWRALVTPAEPHPPEARVYMAPGRHLVSYPLREGRLTNLVAVEERRDWIGESWSQKGDPDRLRALFSDFGGAARPLLERIEAVMVWGLFRHPVAACWAGEGVALLGDAAHPTLPFLAQGANMALEDAWVLAACLDGIEDRAEALRRYQALRRPRVSRVIDAATGNAWKYHLRNPLVRGVAHLGMGLLGRIAPGRMVRQFDWLYGHDVTADR